MSLFSLYQDVFSATMLTAASEGRLFYDEISRFLGTETLDNKALWKQVKPILQKKERTRANALFASMCAFI